MKGEGCELIGLILNQVSPIAKAKRIEWPMVGIKSDRMASFKSTFLKKLCLTCDTQADSLQHQCRV